MRILHGMSDTPNLALPYILAAQSQKHVTHNEALRALDCLVQLSVESRALVNPPTSPSEGARFIPAAGASAEWAGQAGTIAAYQDGAWRFYSAKVGWAAWIADQEITAVYDGTTWVNEIAADKIANGQLADMPAGTIKGNNTGGTANPIDLTGAQATALLDVFVGSGSGHAKGLVPDPGASAGTTRLLHEDSTWSAELQNAIHVGVNATADNANRLSVSSPASLFSHEGHGHQVKVNKNGASDTSKVNKSTGEVTFPAVAQVVVSTFTSSGTWTKPAGARAVKVVMTGGGWRQGRRRHGCQRWRWGRSRRENN